MPVNSTARIHRTAYVRSGAVIGSGAVIHKTTDHLVVGPIGSRSAILTLQRDDNLGVRIGTGCWSGSVDQFMARLKPIPDHDDYRALLPVLVSLLSARMTPTTKNGGAT